MTPAGSPDERPVPPRHPQSPLSQLVHGSAGDSSQSPTYSQTLPTMSKRPQLDTHLSRDPVATGPTPLMTHVLSPSSKTGSGVPTAARCHSWFVASRLPESAHACSACNHEIHVLGSTPATDTA